jgi:hypothetical protein
MKSSSPHNRAKTGSERTQFKPGQSGNPGGRPKTAQFREEVCNFLSEKIHGKTRLRALLEKLFSHKPEVLLHYAYGKPVERMELSGEDVAPIESHNASISDLVAELARRGKTVPTCYAFERTGDPHGKITASNSNPLALPSKFPALENGGQHG